MARVALFIGMFAYAVFPSSMYIRQSESSTAIIMDV